MKKKGLLYFHQGWTDIVNQLSLINYYARDYDQIDLIMRDDANLLVDFYLNGLSNVFVAYCPLVSHNVCGFSYDRSKYDDILFHGTYDKDRQDSHHKILDVEGQFFVKKFYTRYGIDYSNRVTLFDLKRNHELEEKRFNDFIQKHGKDYVVKHETLENRLNNENFASKSINFDNISQCFFDMIKVVENSKEIHVIDSVWAAVIYHIDAKYRLFKNIPVHVYCARGYTDMFDDPVKLDNWFILK